MSRSCPVAVMSTTSQTVMNNANPDEDLYDLEQSLPLDNSEQLMNNANPDEDLYNLEQSFPLDNSEQRTIRRPHAARSHDFPSSDPINQSADEDLSADDNTMNRNTKTPTLMDQIMSLLYHIFQNKKIKASVVHCARDALAAGAGAFVGGLVGGPIGIAVGGAVGGLLGAWMSTGQFKPVSEILMELALALKQKLSKIIYTIISNLVWNDVTQLIIQVVGNASLEKKVVATAINYLSYEMKAAIQYGD